MVQLFYICFYPLFIIVSLASVCIPKLEFGNEATSLDDLIIACGGNNVDYDAKNKCCGFHAELQSPHTAAVLTGNALAGAMDANADWMVTPCPLCHLKLDVQHHGASKAIGREVKLPILHMPQMVGLALGCTPAELGLQHHVTKVNFV